MLKRVMALGIKADYLLMDSWFCFSSLLAKLSVQLPDLYGQGPDNQL